MQSWYCQDVHRCLGIHIANRDEVLVLQDAVRWDISSHNFAKDAVVVQRPFPSSRSPRILHASPGTERSCARTLRGPRASCTPRYSDSCVLSLEIQTHQGRVGRLRSRIRIVDGAILLSLQFYSVAACASPWLCGACQFLNVLVLSTSGYAAHRRASSGEGAAGTDGAKER